jgi:uncharacterized protein
MNWQEFDAKITRLAHGIKEPVDAVVGVLRGGAVPARCLAAKLDVKDMFCLNVRKDGGQRHVTTSIGEDLSGKTVLLVEDVLESGKSLLAAADYLENQKHARVKTVALFHMPQTEIIPSYSLGQTDTVPTLPWEK